MLDCSCMTYADMADIIRAIRDEVKERNSIGVNFYIPYLSAAIEVLDGISSGEQDNFTSESGPIEP